MAVAQLGIEKLEVIKMHGIWKSARVERYIVITAESTDILARGIVEARPTLISRR